MLRRKTARKHYDLVKTKGEMLRCAQGSFSGFIAIGNQHESTHTFIVQ